MPSLLLVMLGGAVGAGARHLTGQAILALFGPGLPWGTLAVNLVGGFAMGVLAGILARGGGAEQWRLLLGVGVLGGFTTFSAFSLDAVTMIERGAAATALAYILASVIGAIGALYAGLTLVRVST
jgi:CrcB protein